MTPADRPHIAVIDDSELLREVTADVLSNAGYKVTTMELPSRTLLQGDATVQLILMDVNMPQIFGDDAALMLKEQWNITAPIVLYSSLDEASLASRAADVKADGYICKSWGTERMIAEVRRLLVADERR